MKSLLILVVLIFVALFSYSQKTFTIADINYNVSPNNSYENGDTTSKAQFFNGFITYPIKLNEKSTILTGIRGNIWNVGYTPELIWPETYYSAGLTIGYNHKFKNEQSFLFILLPRLNSDFVDIDSDAFQLAFYSTYSKRASDKFLWKVGLYFSPEFFGPFLVPLFGLNWDISPKFSIVGDLPIWAKIKYKPATNFSLGLGYIALVSSYRLSGDVFNNAYTSRYAIEPYLFAEVRFIKKLYLYAKFGYTMSRKYPIYAKDDKLDFQLSLFKFGDDRTQLNPVIENNFFFEIGLAFKVEVPENK